MFQNDAIFLVFARKSTVRPKCNASFLGLFAIEGLPNWPVDGWWIPLSVSCLGILANYSLVKLIFRSNQQIANGFQQVTVAPSVVLFVRVAVEALAMLFIYNCDILLETNVIIALLMFCCALLLFLYQAFAKDQ